MTSETPLNDDFEEVARELNIDTLSPAYKKAKVLFMCAISAPGKILEKCQSFDEVIETTTAMSNELAEFHAKLAREKAARN